MKMTPRQREPAEPRRGQAGGRADGGPVPRAASGARHRDGKASGVPSAPRHGPALSAPPEVPRCQSVSLHRCGWRRHPELSICISVTLGVVCSVGWDRRAQHVSPAAASCRAVPLPGSPPCSGAEGPRSRRHHGSACSPWVTLADPGGGDGTGVVGPLRPAHLQARWERFLGGPQIWPWGSLPPLVPSFSPSLLRPVPRGGARLSLPHRELVSAAGAPPGAWRQPCLLHGCTGAGRPVSTRPDRGPGRASGAWTLLLRSLCPHFLRGPSGEHRP